MQCHCVKMEFQKIVNLLDTTSDDKNLPRFVTKKWIEGYDKTQRNYNVNKEIRIKTPMLRSDLWDYSDAYIVVKVNITVTAPDNAKRNKSVAFKNNAPFINCISKINGVQIDNAEDLDVVMPMYNLLEYSKNYRKTTGSLWNYYRDEPSNPLSSNSESFKYKTSITGNTYNLLDGNDDYDATKVGKNETEIVVPLKHLSNLWRTLNIPLIHCEIELILTWTKICALADMTVRAAGNNNDESAIIAPTELEFQITDTNLYVPVVIMLKENNKKLLGQLKSGLKRTVKWNKYRSQKTIRPQNNNLNYLIDPTFTKVNRLFVLLFKRIEENNVKKDHRDSFSYFYMPNIKIKECNVLINGKGFFEMPVKMKKKSTRKLLT